MRGQGVHIGTWRALVQEPALALWAVYILLVPIYLFKSGLPQPGDAFVILLIPVALYRWNGRLLRNARAAFVALIWFTLWVCCVNYGWALLLGNFQVFGPDAFLLHPLYYIYNALVFLTALVLHRRYGDLVLRITVYAVFITIYVQVIASFILPSSAFRGMVFFNNPNQLGYYVLLAASLIALTHRRLGLTLVTSGIALTCCAYLALVSASRAAAGGIAVLLVFLVFSNPKVIVLASLAAIGLATLGGPVTDAVAISEQRAINRTSNVGFFEERGYDRIWKHSEYLVFGAGEGGLSRFGTPRVKHMEIHSSAGTVLFSYGVVGSILFLLFVWRVLSGASWGPVLTLVPPLLYTIAHQGLRFTMLWVLLAIFLALKQERLAAPSRASVNGPRTCPVPGAGMRAPV